MKNALYGFIDSYDDSSIYAFCRDYEEYEQTGVIGDGPLRAVTNLWLARTDSVGGVGTGIWMSMVGLESFRVLVHRNNLLPK